MELADLMGSGEALGPQFAGPGSSSGKPKPLFRKPGEPGWKGSILLKAEQAMRDKQFDREYKTSTLDLQRQRIEMDRAKAEAEQQKAEETAQTSRGRAIQNAQRVIAKVDQVLPKVDWNSSGFVGNMLKGVGGTDAYNLASDVETIQAILGFKELQEMRDASKTGGALGQVALRELDLLQSTLASMKTGQSGPQLQRNLMEVKQHFQNWLAAINGQQMNTTGGGAPGSTMPLGNQDPLGLR